MVFCIVKVNPSSRNNRSTLMSKLIQFLNNRLDDQIKPTIFDTINHIRCEHHQVQNPNEVVLYADP